MIIVPPSMNVQKNLVTNKKDVIKSLRKQRLVLTQSKFIHQATKKIEILKDIDLYLESLHLNFIQCSRVYEKVYCCCIIIGYVVYE